jgi:hypothetical protein
LNDAISSQAPAILALCAVISKTGKIGRFAG